MAERFIDRRSFVGAVTLGVAAYLTEGSPIRAFAAQHEGSPLHEIDPHVLRYGFVQERVPKYTERNTFKSTGGYYQKNTLVRYINVSSDWVEAIPDRLLNRNGQLGTPQHSGIYVPKSYLKDITYSEVAALPFQSGEKRWIEISINKQELWAYSKTGDTVSERWNTSVTTGLHGHDTDIGNFHTFRARWARRMTGPGYDLPGVPLVKYFTESGEALHGAYWRSQFGIRGSHGCVNLDILSAKMIWRFAGPHIPDFSLDEVRSTPDNSGTPVYIRYDKPNIVPR